MMTHSIFLLNKTLLLLSQGKEDNKSIDVYKYVDDEQQDNELKDDELSILYSSIAEYTEASIGYTFVFGRTTLDSCMSRENNWMCKRLVGGGFLLQGFTQIFVKQNVLMKKPIKLCNFDCDQGEVQLKD